MTTLEHKELKGITIKNLVLTIVSTTSIVASVMTTYFQLKDDIHDVKISQQTENSVNDIKLKTLEDQIILIQQQMNSIKFNTLRSKQLNHYLTNSINYKPNY